MDDKKSKRIVWTPKTVKIDSIEMFESNPRIITESGLKQLEESFDEVGMFQPLAINTDNKLLSGHARLMQLKKDGYEEITVMVPDRKLTPKQEKALVIRANKNVAGQWDFDILANEFEFEDLVDWGFKDHELMGMNELGKVNTGDENSEWVGMPEFDVKEGGFKLIIHFETEFYREQFVEKINLEIKKKEKSAWSTVWPFDGKDDLKSLKYE